jgi:hypothetical protein
MTRDDPTGLGASSRESDQVRYAAKTVKKFHGPGDFPVCRFVNRAGPSLGIEPSLGNVSVAVGIA